MSTLSDEILRLKKEKNAIILAHYYQDKEIQEIADYTGDSYKLSVIAKNTNADIIVFCGVHFMAETAKILSPEKKVLLPAINAGCPMANMINEVQLQAYKDSHPDTVVLAYVNSTAKVKALSDCCVTSSNALKIIDYYQAKGSKILYCPDQNLAKYSMYMKNYDFDAWPGYCFIHNKMTTKMVDDMKEKYPNALFLVHPEAPLDVIKKASFVGSTAGIIKFATESENQEFIIGTEKGILHELMKKNPNKKFYMLDESLVCQNMKKTTLDLVYKALLEETNEVIVDSDISIKALKSLNKMIELS